MEKIKAYGVCLYKYTNDSVRVLLCKSTNSNERWGFLKGVATAHEEPVDTAIREFKEECNIDVTKEDLENFYIQKNEYKNIGIYLVNANKIEDLDKYFDNEILLKENLSSENTDVEFFDINNMPLIKKKQKNLTAEILEFFKSKI